MHRGRARVGHLLGVALLTACHPSSRGGQAGGAVPAGESPTPSPLDELPLREHADDVVDYTLHAALDPDAHVVRGDGRIRWRNTSERPVHEMWLHLYLNAFKNERSLFLRERVGGRGSAAPEEWGWIDLRKLDLRERDGSVDLLRTVELRRPGDDDETDARVPLPRDVVPGEAIDLDVSFEDKLPSIVERTGYRGRFHMVAQWFPKVARLEHDGTWAHFPFHHLAEFYADFGTYDVTLDVPAGFVIGATGPRVDERVDGGRRIERHVQRDVHDFAWTAWDRWRTMTERIDGVDVTVLFPPGFGAVARRDLDSVRFALPDYSARYGRYPYSVLTVVHPQEDAGEAGGMEYPTLITSRGPWLQPPGVYVPEIVTVHELGHQWFYGIVATNEAAWPFLDEGVNQFAEVQAMERWRGAGSALDLFGLRVSDGAVQAVGSLPAVHDEPVAQPAASFSSGANYGLLVYGRTASVLDTLARVYGGDTVQRALGLYARRFRFEHPGPDDLVAVFADVVGRGAAVVLRAALFDRGWVDYAIEGVRARRAGPAAGVFDRDGRRETVVRTDAEDDGWDNEVVVRRRGTLVLPVEVDLEMADGSTRRDRWDGAADWTRIAWHGPVAVTAAVVDPEHRVTIDANPQNNAGMASDARGHAPRVLERVTYWVQLALQAVSP